LARKKKKVEESEPEKEEADITEIEDFEDFEEDFQDDLELDLEKELELIDSEDIEGLEEAKIIDKDEATKQLYLSCGIHIGTKLLSGDARRFIYRQPTMDCMLLI